MTQKIVTFRQAPRMLCAWRLTGDSKTPLACAWTLAQNASATSALPPPAETEEGGLRLCA